MPNRPFSFLPRRVRSFDTAYREFFHAVSGLPTRRAGTSSTPFPRMQAASLLLNQTGPVVLETDRLRFAAVPEPSTWMLLAGSMILALALGWWRRRL